MFLSAGSCSFNFSLWHDGWVVHFGGGNGPGELCVCVYRGCADEFFADLLFCCFADWIMNENGAVVSRGRDETEPILDIMSAIKDC